VPFAASRGDVSFIPRWMRTSPSPIGAGDSICGACPRPGQLARLPALYSAPPGLVTRRQRCGAQRTRIHGRGPADDCGAAGAMTRWEALWIEPAMRICTELRGTQEANSDAGASQCSGARWRSASSPMTVRSARNMMGGWEFARRCEGHKADLFWIALYVVPPSFANGQSDREGFVWRHPCQRTTAAWEACDRFRSADLAGTSPQVNGHWDGYGRG
jgi:hypothetical protein